jgi:hypothetical protein
MLFFSSQKLHNLRQPAFETGACVKGGKDFQHATFQLPMKIVGKRLNIMFNFCFL